MNLPKTKVQTQKTPQCTHTCMRKNPLSNPEIDALDPSHPKATVPPKRHAIPADDEKEKPCLNFPSP